MSGSGNDLRQPAAVFARRHRQSRNRADGQSTGPNQTFNPAIGAPPDGTAALNATIVLQRRHANIATTSTLTSSSPTVTYGNTVTFTDSITASSGGSAPALGSVDFIDTTTHTDLDSRRRQHRFRNGTVTTVSFTTGVKTFNYTTGDVIEAVYTPGIGFARQHGQHDPGGQSARHHGDGGYQHQDLSTALPRQATRRPSPRGSLVAGDTAAFTETYDTAASAPARR